MKVLVSRFAQEYAGAERNFVTHLVELKQLGHQTVGFTNVPEAKSRLKSERIKHYDCVWFKWQLPFLVKAVLLALPQFIQLLSIIHKEDPDVINPHSRFDQIAFSLLKPLHRRAIVWKDPADLKYRLRYSTGLKRWLYVRSISLADFIYTVSNFEVRAIKRMLPASIDKGKITMIRSGLNLGDYQVKIKKESPRSHFIIGYTGRLHPKKGLYYLLMAAPVIIKKLPQAQIWIVGEGEDRERLQSLVRVLKIESHVKFWGRQKDISKFLNRFDLYVMPTLGDGWSLAIHEARLFGKAIVASRVGGVPEQIKDSGNGLLVSPKDSGELSRAILKIEHRGGR